MKYTRIQRRDHEDFITIGEYIQETEPSMYRTLSLLRVYLPVRTMLADTWDKLKDVTDRILAAVDVSGADKLYQYIMQERPHSGRGGLLPGEKEEDLYEL